MLKDINKCKELDIHYDGETYQNGDEKTGYRFTKIIDGSMEQTIIADWMEVNMGFCWTTDMVNQYRRDMGKTEIGRSAVMGKIEKNQQGNKNHASWSLIRKNQTKQFMRMSGIITEHELTLEFLLGISEYFNPAHLSTIECE